MPAKASPSEISRDIVHVVSRERTSIVPDVSAAKRSLADSGTNLTLSASLKMAAARARHRSTSNPVHFPLSSGMENPCRPWLTPQDSEPRSWMALRVWAEAGRVAASAAAAVAKARRFMTDPPRGGWKPFLELGSVAHDHPGAHRHPIIQIDDGVVHQAEATRRHGIADCLRLVGAVDAVDGVAEVERARAQRVAGAAGHEAGQVRLARNHLGRWGPVGPFRLARDRQEAGPLETFAADADAVAQRPVVALDHVEEALRRVDHDGSGGFGGAEEHHLPLVGRRDVFFLRRRLVARRLFDRHFLLLQVRRLAALRECRATQPDHHHDGKPVPHYRLPRHGLASARPSARRRAGCISTAFVPASMSRSTWSAGSLKRVGTFDSSAARAGSN